MDSLTAALPTAARVLPVRHLGLVDGFNFSPEKSHLQRVLAIWPLWTLARDAQTHPKE